jgi:PAS domain S-box-containing protein
MENLYSKVVPASILENTVIAQGVNKITFNVGSDFKFSPGQYVWLEIEKLVSDDPLGNRRAFSISSVPGSEGSISIISRISAGGFKQTLAALKAGDDIRLHGPFGSSFVLDETKNDSLVMIAGGVGISPFLPVIETIKLKNLHIKTHLLYINTSKENTPFLNDLEKLQNDNERFNYVTKFDHFTWEDINNLILKDTGHKKYLISGPQEMVDSVFEVLSQNGVSEDDMLFENYYPTRKNGLTIEKMKEQMKEEGILTQAIQNSTNHTVITDSNGIVLFANKAAQMITGYSESEILGNTPRLWGGIMSPEFYIKLWKEALDGKPFVGEITNRRKSGEIYHAIAHISPIFEKDKEVIGFVGTEEDISERVNSEEDLRQSQYLLNSIVENIPMMIFAKDAKELKFTLFNKAGEMLTGLTREEVVGKNDEALFPKEQADFFIEKDREVIESKKLLDIPEEPIKTKEKGERILHTRKIPLFDLKGNSQYLLGVSEDITEAKANQERLNSKNHELESLNKIMVGRELKMIELKKEIERLKK